MRKGPSSRLHGIVTAQTPTPRSSFRPVHRLLNVPRIKRSSGHGAHARPQNGLNASMVAGQTATGGPSTKTSPFEYSHRSGLVVRHNARQKSCGKHVPLMRKCSPSPQKPSYPPDLSPRVHRNNGVPQQSDGGHSGWHCSIGPIGSHRPIGPVSTATSTAASDVASADASWLLRESKHPTANTMTTENQRNIRRQRRLEGHPDTRYRSRHSC